VKIIVVSHPDFLEDEIPAVQLLFENGLEYFHVRKPLADKDSYRNFIKKIAPCYHTYLIIHNYFELVDEFEIKGIHLTSKNTKIPTHSNVQISRSCHNFEEIITHKPYYDYLFLSPIFNSISKQGYTSAFSSDKLEEAKEKHIIDNKVIALGGINSETIHQIKKWDFGGIAVLGYLWEDFKTTKNSKILLHHLSLLQNVVKE
jgi:thiamine-phosphate pyrophosphorylase